MLNQKKRQEAMKQFFKNAITSTVDWVKGMGSRVKTGVVAVCIAILSPVGAFAQSLANTGYDAGTSAMEEVATQIAAYVPYVVNLCYALAGVVAIVGAISVYIAMNQEEDHDGGRCLHLPDCSRQRTSSVLRYHRLTTR